MSEPLRNKKKFILNFHLVKCCLNCAQTCVFILACKIELNYQVDKKKHINCFKFIKIVKQLLAD